MGIYKGLEGILDFPATEQHRTDFSHAVIDRTQTCGFNIKGNTFAVQRQIAAAYHRLLNIHVIHEVAFHTVDDFHAVVLPCVPQIRECLYNTMVSYGNRRNTPFLAALYKGFGIGQCVGIGESGM